jgi:2-dehydropantoate 2-reductase
VRLPVATDVADVAWRDTDVLLLATKSQDTADLLAAVRDALPQRVEPAVVCLQNGVANERMALRRFARVYGVVVMMPAVLIEPGRIDAQGAPYAGLLDLGRFPRGRDALCDDISAAFEKCGFTSQPVDDVMRWKRAKLLRNLGNGIEAMCGHDIDDAGMAVVRDLDARMRDEAIAVFRAAGLEWASEDEWRGRRGDKVQHTPVEGRTRAGGSTWQSLARGTGRVEVDYLNGEVVLLGRLHGVPTPVNETVRRLANRAAADGAAPGSVRPESLAEAVRAATS